MTETHIPSEVSVPRAAWEALTGFFNKLGGVDSRPGETRATPGENGGKGPPSFEKATPRTLYVRRDLKNAAEFIRWAKDQGFETTLPAGELHVTIAYSKQPLDWMKVPATWSGGDSKGELTVSPGGARLVERLGDKGEAIALLFTSAELSWRHGDIIQAGASYDWPDYQPHVTITWKGGDIDLDKVEPFQGKLVFGPEVFEEIEDNWSDGVVEKRQTFEIMKVSDEQRMIYGWASVISKDGQPYFDGEGDTIEPDELEKAATAFMKDVRLVSDHHERHEDGSFTPALSKGDVVHSFPMTAPIMKALDIESSREGWIIGVYCRDDAMWKAVKDGVIKGFSIGGRGRRQAIQ